MKYKEFAQRRAALVGPGIGPAQRMTLKLLFKELLFKERQGAAAP
jgi:hypothetical protein